MRWTKKLLAFVLSLTVLCAGGLSVGILQGIVSAEEIVDVQFRSLDDDADLQGDDQMAKSVSQTQYTEGTGSLAFTISELQGTSKDLFFYVHALNEVPVNAAGATAMIFDIYCPNEAFAAALPTFTGDGGVNIDSAALQGSGYGSTAGHIQRENGFRPALQNLQVGWNHVVMPLEEPITATDISKFRFYIKTMPLTPGMVFYLDDIRFVNQVYLDSQAYIDVNAAKAVTAAIAVLTEDSSAEEINAVKNLYEQLTEAQQALVSNLDHLEKYAEKPTVVLFRDLDKDSRTAQEAATSTAGTENCTQGVGAALFEHAADRTGLFWYVYCENNVASTGVDITGTTHLLFDFYVSDPTLWDLGKSDCRIAIRSVGANGWSSDVAEVSAASLRAAFSEIKQGWNHLVLPLTQNSKTDAMAFRFYFADGTAKRGFYTIMDHVRFANQKYLDSEAYANELAAADVQAMISALTNDSTAEQISAARQSYTALTATQKVLVANVSRLEKIENGEPLTAPKTFTALPEAHLTERAPAEESEFTLAVMSDLHYATKWNGQQKDIYWDSMRWLAAQAKEENLKMAVQLGDLTCNNRMFQWEIVREGFDILKEAGVPYGAVIGNHDYGNGKSPAAFNGYFPAEEEIARNPYFADAKDAGKMQNCYYTFTENGVNYMLLMLECYPSTATIRWADRVIKLHPTHNVIVFTHSYLSSENQPLGFTQEVEALAAGFNGKTIWDGIIKDNPNVFMTLSAHNFNQGESQMWVQNNAAGNPVYQVLMVDPQDYENIYGAMGFTYLIRFDDFGRKVSMEYVSSRYNKDFAVTDCNFTFEPKLVYTEEAQALMAQEEAGIAATAVDALIDAIGTVTKQSAGAITAARQGYDALSDASKTLVTKLAILEAAEAAFEQLTHVTYGDVNDDGTVDATDALAVLKYAVGKQTFTDDQKKLAELDGEDPINAADALLILKKAVNKIDTFPIEQ